MKEIGFPSEKKKTPLAPEKSIWGGEGLDKWSFMKTTA